MLLYYQENDWKDRDSTDGGCDSTDGDGGDGYTIHTTSTSNSCSSNSKQITLLCFTFFQI